MKRLLVAGLILALTCFSSMAQQSSPQGDPDRLFYIATEQYQNGEYAGCFRALETWFVTDPSAAHLEEACFLRAASAYELNRRETSLLLLSFLTDYPASPYAEKACYLLGCSAMDAGQYADALAFFRRCPETNLTKKERVSLRFRFAYVSMQLGDNGTARNLFSDLASGESRYAASAGFFLAYMDYAAGMAREASAGFDNYADNDQLNALLPCFNIQLVYAGGKPTEAIQEASKLLPTIQDPVQKAELTRILGAASFDIKEYARSRQAYIEYLAGNPTIHRTDLYRIGVLNYIGSEYDKAISRLSAIAGKEDAISQSASYHLGMCYLKKSNNEQARMCFEQASLADFDKNTKEKALYNYAVLCHETAFTAFNEQVNAFQRFLDEFPRSELADKANGYLAEALLSSKDYRNSFSVLERVANPDINLLQIKARLLFLLGTEAFGNKQYDEALLFFNQSAELAAKVSVSATETYYWRGETYFQLDLFGQAYADWKRFTEQAKAQQMKAWPSALYGLGYSSFELKNYTESLKWFEKFTLLAGAENDVRYADVLNRIGDCYFMLKQYDKAGQLYQRADKATSGGNDYAVYQEAITLGLKKQYQAKLTLLNQFETRFLVSDYTDDILFEAGKTYSELKDKDQAIAVFSRLMETYPNSPLSRKAGIQIALLHFNNQAVGQAIEAYKKVIEHYPGSQEAQVALGDLKMIHVSNNTVSEFINYTRDLKVPVALNAEEQDSLNFMAAENKLMEGNNQEAMQAFEQYINQFPNGHYLADSHYHLAKLMLASNDLTGAIPHLIYVADQTGHRFQRECLEILAESYFQQTNYQEANTRYAQLEKLASNRNSRIAAQMGLLRCQFNLGNDNEVITMTGKQLSEKNLDTGLLTEVRYYRAISYLNTTKNDLAKADLIILAKEVQTQYGAESRFLLAELYFKQNNLREAEKIVNQFIQEGTPHSYWLAHSFILLADIHMQRKDDFQAKQYLLSLKENYKADDDITGLIEARLNKIAQRNN